MGYRNAVPKLLVGKNQTVLLVDGPATIVDFCFESPDTTGILVEFLNGDQKILGIVEFLEAADVELFPEGRVSGPAADDLLWSGLSDHKKNLIDQRMRDLTLVETGDPDGDIYAGTARPEHIDPRYDPAAFTLKQRRDRMSADIASRDTPQLGGHSPDTLRRQAHQVRLQGGRNALIHGRTGYRSQRGLTPEISGVINQYVRSEADASGKSEEAHLSQLRRELRKAGLGSPLEISDYRLRKAYRDATQGKGFQSSTTTRRSKAGRPDPSRGNSKGWDLSVPYSFLELDSTPIDTILVDQYGRVLKTVHLLAAVCAATRKVAGLRLTTSEHPYDSREVRGLLWDCIRGRVTGQSKLRALSLPENVLFMPFQPPAAPSHFDTANIDRGSQFNNPRTLGSMSRLGVNVRLNDPGRGVQKPHVEAFLGTMTAFGQKLPGYTGSGVHLRGLGVEKGPLLRIDDFVELLWVLLDRVYHPRPHSQLRHPDFPAHRFSPNEYMELLLRSGGCMTAEVDLERALTLLDMRHPALQPQGLEINGRWYDSPQVTGLKDGGLGDRGRPGLRVTAYVDDRHPEFVMVRLPNGDIDYATSKDKFQLAPLSDLLSRDIRNAVGEDQDRAQVRRDVRAVEDDLVDVAWSLAEPASALPAPTPATSGHPKSRKLSVAPDPTEEPDESALEAALTAALRDIRSAR